MQQGTLRAPKRIGDDRATAQQRDYWAALVDGARSVLCEARAGCSKSSASREGMFRVLDRTPAARIRYTVFNTANAKEFAADAPDGVEVGTIHSFGFKALVSAFRSQIEKNKTYILLDEMREARNLPRYMRKAVSLLASHAKNQALHPDAEDVETRCRQLALHYDVRTYGREPLIVAMAIEVLRRSLAWTDVVDFDDMAYLPAMLALPFDPVDWLFIDEAQDLNPCQHALIPLMACGARVVVVGDRYQSIYGFRGADPASIPRLEKLLAGRDEGAASLPLTITFRCPKSHVTLARQFVSDIEAHPSNQDGEIGEAPADRSMRGWQPGDFVLCAANAPLVRAALGLIAERRPAVVRGRGIGDQLLAVWRNAENAKTCAEATRLIEQWKGRELLRLSELDGVDDLVESVEDRAAGLLAVVGACSQVSEVPQAISELFADGADPRAASAVVFSTIHRAKGLEADRVSWIQTPTRPPVAEWEKQQARNLSYVALTRAKQSLTFITQA
ncbi:MAG: UvrD-helicase domain-containing protein [Gemmataceae bacterium]